MAFFESAMSLGQVKGWLGIIFLFVAILVKIKKEVEFMQEIFGSAFQSYKVKVKKLIPGLY